MFGDDNDNKVVDKDIRKDRVYILYIYNSITRQYSGGDLADMLVWLCKQVPKGALEDGTELEDAITLAFHGDITDAEAVKLQALRDLYVGVFDGKVLPPPEMQGIFKRIVDAGCEYKFKEESEEQE